eukprot:c25412_g1_i1.p1 GENE.c25412_g1_i1~~c25412_g1_i1.p1  ORF type:complete len:1176 (+),score=183.35 c25412_g1_i1:1-3528(+)
MGITLGDKQVLPFSGMTALRMKHVVLFLMGLEIASSLVVVANCRCLFFLGVLIGCSKCTSFIRDNSNLVGSLGEELGTAIENSELTVLSLMNNAFTGPLPHSIGFLALLQQLRLSGNRLSGDLPTQLGRCTALVALLLDRNLFQGPIPTELGRLNHLASLDLSGNAFTATIPSEMARLTALTSFRISQNQLQGSIPLALATGWVALAQLFLNENSLTGQIPHFASRNLVTVNLEKNRFQGTIPTSLGLATALTSLQLGQNRLTGEIPRHLGGATRLQTVKLDFNEISGTLPSTLASLTNLISLSIEGNKLQGQLPTFRTATSLSLLNASRNEFTGTIPSEYGGRSLTRIDVSQNAGLRGTIPSTLATINSALAKLNFSHTGLRGMTPPIARGVIDITHTFMTLPNPLAALLVCRQSLVPRASNPACSLRDNIPTQLQVNGVTPMTTTIHVHTGDAIQVVTHPFPFTVTSATCANQNATKLQKASEPREVYSTEVTDSTPEGTVTFSLEFANPETGSRVQTQQAGFEPIRVVVDNTAPLIHFAGLASGNTFDSTLAINGDLISLLVLVGDHSDCVQFTGALSDSNGTTFQTFNEQVCDPARFEKELTVSHRVACTEADGQVGLILQVSDVFGNTTSASATLDGSTVTIDCTRPATRGPPTLTTDNEEHPVLACNDDLLIVAVNLTEVVSEATASLDQGRRLALAQVGNSTTFALTTGIAADIVKEGDNHTIDITCRDMAGNVGQARSEVALSVVYICPSETSTASRTNTKSTTTSRSASRSSSTSPTETATNSPSPTANPSFTSSRSDSPSPTISPTNSASVSQSAGASPPAAAGQSNANVVAIGVPIVALAFVIASALVTVVIMGHYQKRRHKRGSVVTDAETDPWFQTFRQLLAIVPVPMMVEEAVWDLPYPREPPSDAWPTRTAGAQERDRQAWLQLIEEHRQWAVDLVQQIPELTVEHIIALRLYTLQRPRIYRLLNMALTSPTRWTEQGLSADLTSCLPLIKLLTIALESLPPSFVGPMEGYRAIRDQADYEEEEYEHRYARDSSFYWYSFASATTDNRVAREFAGRDGLRTIFKITAVRAYNIQRFSMFPREMEFMFPPLTRFRVLGHSNVPYDNSNQERVVVLEQIDEDEPSRCRAFLAKRKPVGIFCFLILLGLVSFCGIWFSTVKIE